MIWGQSEKGTSPTSAEHRRPGSRSRSSACRPPRLAAACTSQADYPLDAPRRSRHTKEFMIDLEPSQAGAAP